MSSSSTSSTPRKVINAAPVTTASIAPEKFANPIFAAHRPVNPRVVFVLLACFIISGFGLRAYDLSAEGLSEDELNKLQAVADYRQFGLSSANAEHPMLMKAIQTVSVVLSEKWNEAVTGQDENLSASPVAAMQETAQRRRENLSDASLSRDDFQPLNQSTTNAGSTFLIAPETALRLPAALFGALTALLIFLFTRELFGTPVALLAAAMWAFDPTAIGLNRIAKEDTFFIFFFILASFFFTRAQTRAERDGAPFNRWLYLTAAAFGMMIAAKYYPHFMGIIGAYYYMFLGLPTTRLHVGKMRWLMFFVVIGVAFVLCNLTILLPATWREMLAFASEKRIAHDSTEYIGTLYPNRMSLWLRGVPVSFFYIFLLTKTTLPMLAAFFAGLTQVVRRRAGDGRLFLLFWLLIGFLPFTLLGGKFTRYYTLVLPLIHIVAAIGARWFGALLARGISSFFASFKTSSTLAPRLAHGIIALIIIASLTVTSFAVMPYYRLYNNALGGGMVRAGELFPHDDFYDASMRDAVYTIARDAAPNARIASESPRLFLHYAALAGRADLQAVSLSDPNALAALQPYDYVIIARGRRYRSNDFITQTLPAQSQPAFRLSLAATPSIQIFKLDPASFAIIRQ
ncbi:MAG: glycosyltransferase family 39 protein [Pyrinomonadaceae bacterium MAG19_C2-C3]|nr:glycosyltransferase family 39 protein [Pyrinomonadaceae bacterium MAG19_C2-C3]